MTPRPHLADNDSAGPLVIISILNWNGWRNTIECLEAVYSQNYAHFLPVVLDNGSWDGSAEQIRRWAIEHMGEEATIVDYDEQSALSGGIPEQEARLDTSEPRKRLVLVRTRENLGWAGGNNLVAAYALSKRTARFVFFLNNDAILDPHSLSILVEGGSHFRKVILAPSGEIPGADVVPERLSLFRFLFAPLVSPGCPAQDAEGVSESDVVTGMAMLVSREVLEDPLRTEGEYFSSRIFLYWEDQLFCHLARRRGSHVGYVRGATVAHKGSASSGGCLGPLLFYYRERGKILAANAALPFGLRVLFHVVNPWLCVARVAKYARANPECAKAALWGLADGLRGVGGKWRDHDRFARQPREPLYCLAEEKGR